jgi:20S proteasome subunit alpha 4
MVRSLLNIFTLLTLCRKANAIGRSSKTVREFLERNHKADMSPEETIKLTVRSLLEVVQTGAKNIEIAVIEPHGTLRLLPDEDIEKYVEEINNEKQEEAQKRPGRSGTTSGTAATGASASGTAGVSLPTREAEDDI